MNRKPRFSDVFLANFQPYSVVAGADVFRIKDELPSTSTDAQLSATRSGGGRWCWE